MPSPGSGPSPEGLPASTSHAGSAEDVAMCCVTVPALIMSPRAISWFRPHRVTSQADRRGDAGRSNRTASDLRNDAPRSAMAATWIGTTAGATRGDRPPHRGCRDARAASRPFPAGCAQIRARPRSPRRVSFSPALTPGRRAPASSPTSCRPAAHILATFGRLSVAIPQSPPSATGSPYGNAHGVTHRAAPDWPWGQPTISYVDGLASARPRSATPPRALARSSTCSEPSHRNPYQGTGAGR